LSLVGLLLFCDVYYHQAPWEIAYRQQGLDAMRVELTALPSADGATSIYPLTNQETPSMLAQYPLRVACDDVYAHYRQVAPAAGWTFLGSERAGAGDDYTGTFAGYTMRLEVGCDTSGYHPVGSGRYEILVTIPFPHNIKGLPW